MEYVIKIDSSEFKSLNHNTHDLILRLKAHSHEPYSIRIESSFIQSSSQLIRIESESRSHEQISPCNNGACSTLHAYHFLRQIDLLFSLQYQEVFQRAHQPSAKCKRCQNYGGLLQCGILIDLLIPCLIC